MSPRDPDADGLAAHYARRPETPTPDVVNGTYATMADADKPKVPERIERKEFETDSDLIARSIESLYTAPVPERVSFSPTGRALQVDAEADAADDEPEAPESELAPEVSYLLDPDMVDPAGDRLLRSMQGLQDADREAIADTLADALREATDSDDPAELLAEWRAESTKSFSAADLRLAQNWINAQPQAKRINKWLAESGYGNHPRVIRHAINLAKRAQR